MDDRRPVWDIGGPVQADVLVVWLDVERIALTGPCGAAPWLLELRESDHPVEVVTRMVGEVIGPPLLVHSTSWRRDRGAVILTFVVVIDQSLVGRMGSEAVERVDLARSSATEAPASIGHLQVLEHGLRHRAWLAGDDPVVGRTLSPSFHKALAAYVPEPFQALG